MQDYQSLIAYSLLSMSLGIAIGWTIRHFITAPRIDFGELGRTLLFISNNLIRAMLIAIAAKAFQGWPATVIGIFLFLGFWELALQIIFPTIASGLRRSFT